MQPTTGAKLMNQYNANVGYAQQSQAYEQDACRERDSIVAMQRLAGLRERLAETGAMLTERTKRIVRQMPKAVGSGGLVKDEQRAELFAQIIDLADSMNREVESMRETIDAMEV